MVRDKGGGGEKRESTNGIVLFDSTVDELKVKHTIHRKKVQLPAGTSDYQAAWIVRESDGSSDEVSFVCVAAVLYIISKCVARRSSTQVRKMVTLKVLTQ